MHDMVANRLIVTVAIDHVIDIYIYDDFEILKVGVSPKLVAYATHRLKTE